MFSIHLGLPNKFFNLKIRKFFLKTKNKMKKQLPNIPVTLVLVILNAYNMHAIDV